VGDFVSQFIPLEPLDVVGALHTELGYHFGGLLLALRATRAKIDELRETQWFDPQADRWTNKQRMKTLGGALFAYDRVLTRMIISAMAIAVESFAIDVKAATGVSFNTWDPTHDDLRHIVEVRKVSALHNVIKHNQGVIRRNSSASAKFLVDKCGLPQDTPVEYLSLDLEQLIFRVHVCALALIERVSGVRVPILNLDEAEMRRLFESRYVPDSIDI
jgi:hypothetical protein